jgi:hypothetical protein
MYMKLLNHTQSNKDFGEILLFVYKTTSDMYLKS